MSVPVYARPHDTLYVAPYESEHVDCCIDVLHRDSVSIGQ